MKLCLISSSPRSGSETRRITDALADILGDLECETEVVDLFTENVTSNLSDIQNNVGGAGELVGSINERFKVADGFVVVTPEWGGMASPALKTLFMVADNMANKPAALVSVSAGRGGAYPIAELRSSSYKNTKICYIPDQLIVRDCASAFSGEGSPNDEYTTARAIFTMRSLIAYANALKPLQDLPDLYVEEYAHGMG